MQFEITCSNVTEHSIADSYCLSAIHFASLSMAKSVASRLTPRYVA